MVDVTLALFVELPCELRASGIDSASLKSEGAHDTLGTRIGRII